MNRPGCLLLIGLMLSATPAGAGLTVPANRPGLISRAWLKIGQPGRATLPAGSMVTFPTTAAPRKAQPAAALDLNSASLEQLQNLPGVGAAWAPKILAGRPYRIIDDLARDGIPLSTIEQIRSRVYLGP